MRGSALWSGLESRQRPERSTTSTPSRNHPPPAPSSPSVRAVHAPRSSSPSAWAPPPTPTRAALLPFPRQAFRLSPVSSPLPFHRGLLLLLLSTRIRGSGCAAREPSRLSRRSLERPIRGASAGGVGFGASSETGRTPSSSILLLPPSHPQYKGF
ncbi:hypothetical protein DAI22_07g051101 [Oryza sativa Japonica Group]|nr:hypothetical protein DAI22_07g051101 [Oryza sativa Japonica Group]